MSRRCLVIAAAAVLLLGGVAAADANPAAAWLAEALSTKAGMRNALPALRATKDASLLPVFEALSRSGDRTLRAFAVQALPSIAKDRAAPALKERLSKDPSNAIRATALVHLLTLQAVSNRELADVITKIPDENIQSLATGALVHHGQAATAARTLRKLAASTDVGTAASAQLSLLGMGFGEHKAGLLKTAADPETPSAVLVVIVRQISRDKIKSAGELARRVAESDRPIPVRVAAYQALSDVMPAGGGLVRDALIQSNSTVLRVYLLRVLAKRKDAATHLAPLARQDVAVGALARLERARSASGPEASTTASAAMALGHPIVLDYVIDCARKDVEKYGAAAGFYVPGLLKYIRSVDGDAADMGARHIRAATVATVLTDLGTPRAVEGLQKILSGKYGSAARSVGAGLLRAKNRAAAVKLARPLLKSPYEELAVDAVLTLGRFGDTAARPHLKDIVARADTHRPATVAMAAWYLVRMDGKADAVAKDLAGRIK